MPHSPSSRPTPELAVAAERRVGTHRAAAVDPDRAGADLLRPCGGPRTGSSHQTLAARPYAVSFASRMASVGVLERQDHRDRAEDLLLDGARVRAAGCRAAPG